MKSMLMKILLRFLPSLLPEKVRTFLLDRRVRAALAVVVGTLVAIQTQFPEYADIVSLVIEGLATLGLVMGAAVPTPVPPAEVVPFPVVVSGGENPGAPPVPPG